MKKKLLFVCLIACIAVFALAGCSFLFSQPPAKEKVQIQLATVESVSYDAETEMLSFSPVANAKSYTVTVSHSPDYEVYSFGTLKAKPDNLEYLPSYDDEGQMFAQYMLPPNTYGHTFVFTVFAYGYADSDDTHVYDYQSGEPKTCEYVYSNEFASTDNLAADIVELVERRLPLELIEKRFDYYDDLIPQRILEIDYSLDEETELFCINVTVMTDGYDKKTSHDVIKVSFRYEDATSLADVRDDLGSYTQYEVSFPYNRNYAESPPVKFQDNYERAYELVCAMKYRSGSSKTEYQTAKAELDACNAQLIYGYTPIRERSDLQSKVFYFRGEDAEAQPKWYCLNIVTDYLSGERITVVQDTMLTEFEPYQTDFIEQYYALRTVAASAE